MRSRRSSAGRCASIRCTQPSMSTSRLAARRGEFAAAERQLRRLAEMPRPSGMVLDELFHLQLNKGQIANVLQSGKRLVMQKSPELGHGFNLWYLALPYAHLGMMAQAEHWSARARREQPGDYHAATWRPQNELLRWAHRLSRGPRGIQSRPGGSWRRRGAASACSPVDQNR
jgi:hypothetical protein